MELGNLALNEYLTFEIVVRVKIEKVIFIDGPLEICILGEVDNRMEKENLEIRVANYSVDLFLRLAPHWVVCRIHAWVNIYIDVIVLSSVP